jgi:hypothetical protein
VTPRLPATAFRLLVLVAAWVLGTSTLSLAQEEPPATVDATAVEPEPEEAQDDGVLIVPDVRGLPYVFAKGVLEDWGFAWKVKGKVEGFAVNLVASQSVEPTTKVLDTGAPTIVLELKKNPEYEEKGLAQDRSPYPGTKLVLAGGGDPQPATLPAEEDAGAADDDTDASTQEPETAPPAETEPTATEPTATEPENTETADYEEAANTSVDSDAEAEADAESLRPPAFPVAGAPREPLDEISLPERARDLRAWVADLDKVTPAALDHFAYQHAWVVTGAEFGWWQGAEALTILIQADEQLQQKFGTGAKYEAAARAALAEVERKSKAAS